MLIYFMSGIAARVATVLCLALIALPYWLRRRSREPGSGRKGSYLQRMWPHFWLGYAVLGLTVMHVGTVMPAMGRANSAGIWAATFALFLLFLEVVLGLNLKDEQGSARRAMRRVHFWVMVGFVGGLGVHLWANA